MEHTHEDERLTFACPACIERVQADQHRAAIQEEPNRPLTVAWSASNYGTITIEAKYLADEEPFDVAERNYDRIHDAVIEQMEGITIELLDASFGKKIRT